MRQFVITFSKYWGDNSVSVPQLIFGGDVPPVPSKSTPLLITNGAFVKFIKIVQAYKRQETRDREKLTYTEV